MKTNRQKIAGKQYLRYVKTFSWAIRRKKDEVLAAVGLRTMPFYPCDQPTLEDAIADMEHDFNLRETSMSKTDLYAIMEAMQYIQTDDTKDRSTETGADSQDNDWVSDQPLSGGSDKEIDSPRNNKGAKRGRKRKDTGS